MEAVAVASVERGEGRRVRRGLLDAAHSGAAVALTDNKIVSYLFALCMSTCSSTPGSDVTSWSCGNADMLASWLTPRCADQVPTPPPTPSTSRVVGAVAYYSHIFLSGVMTSCPDLAQCRRMMTSPAGWLPQQCTGQVPISPPTPAVTTPGPPTSCVDGAVWCLSSYVPECEVMSRSGSVLQVSWFGSFNTSALSEDVNVDLANIFFFWCLCDNNEAATESLTLSANSFQCQTTSSSGTRTKITDWNVVLSPRPEDNLQHQRHDESMNDGYLEILERHSQPVQVACLSPSRSCS